MNYQGRLTDENGGPLSQDFVDLTFRFYGSVNGSTILLTVFQDEVPVKDGVYNVDIGTGAVIPGTNNTMSGAFEKNPVVYMGIEVDSEPEMVPRVMIADRNSAPVSISGNTIKIKCPTSECKTKPGAQALAQASFGKMPSYIWTKRLGGPSGDRDTGRGIVADQAGNIYTIGYFFDTVDFAADFGGRDPKTSAGKNDVYVIKITADGKYAWTKRFGGPGEEFGYAIAVDSQGNVYATGYFSGTVNFQEDFDGTDVKTSAGDFDAFLLKINADGSYGWSRRIGGVGDDRGLDLSLDGGDNIYLTGCFMAVVDFGQDFGGSDVKPSSGGKDVFVMKINADGSYAWTRKMGGGMNDTGYGITTMNDGVTYVVGIFAGSLDFAADFGGSDKKESKGKSNIFVTRINAGGAYGWTRRMGGEGNDFGFCIDADQKGNIALTGYFYNQVDFGDDFGVIDIKQSAGGADAFVTSINADGSYAWTRRIGGSAGDVAYGISVDVNGDIYISGVFQNTVDFAQDFGGSDPKISAGATDVFVMRIANSGEYRWTRRMGGSGSDNGYNIFVDRFGTMFVTGNFDNTVNFAEDFGRSDSKAAAGGGDVFISKISQP